MPTNRYAPTPIITSEEEGDAWRNKSGVGIARYDGNAYFWHYDYRHYLRDIPRAGRKAVHNALLRSGLSLDGSSPEHERVIARVSERYPSAMLGAAHAQGHPKVLRRYKLSKRWGGPGHPRRRR